MPHLILEYSANLPAHISPQAMLKNANQALLASGEIQNPHNLKSRAIRCDNYLVGAGDSDNAFVHARLHLLSGRSPATRRALCQAVCEALAGLLGHTGASHIEITAEAIDMATETYAKVVLAPAA